MFVFFARAPMLTLFLSARLAYWLPSGALSAANASSSPPQSDVVSSLAFGKPLSSQPSYYCHLRCPPRCPPRCPHRNQSRRSLVCNFHRQPYTRRGDGSGRWINIPMAGNDASEDRRRWKWTKPRRFRFGDASNDRFDLPRNSAQIVRRKVSTDAKIPPRSGKRLFIGGNSEAIRSRHKLTRTPFQAQHLLNRSDDSVVGHV